MRTRSWRWLLVFGLAAVAVLWLPASGWACPTCKDGMTNDADSAALIQGYFWSIIFMMSMPFLILGSLGTYFYLQVRKARRQPRLAPNFQPLHAP